MDNYGGQNKKKHVIHLAPYLTMRKYFEKLCILFLVAGYTKNIADWLFNFLNQDYRRGNVFSLAKLIQVCNTNQYFSAYKVVWTDFYNWSTFLTIYLRVKLKAINKYHLFEFCSKNGGTVECQSSALTNNVTYDDDLLPMTVQA